MSSLLDRHAVMDVKVGILTKSHPTIETDFLTPCHRAFRNLGYLVTINEYEIPLQYKLFMQDHAGKTTLAEGAITSNLPNYYLYIACELDEDFQLSVGLPSGITPEELEEFEKLDEIAVSIITFGIDAISVPVREDLMFWNGDEITIG